MKTCPDCNGDGVIDKGTDDEKQCPTCAGSGFVPDDNDDKNNEEVIKTGAGSDGHDCAFAEPIESTPFGRGLRLIGDAMV
jgi:DnaJ-class molecular chaperone